MLWYREEFNEVDNIFFYIRTYTPVDDDDDEKAFNSSSSERD